MSAPPHGIQIVPVAMAAEVAPDDDLVDLLATSLSDRGIQLTEGDVLVVASKIVAKAEGRQVTPEPGETPAALRRRLTYEQADEVLAETPHVVVVRTRHGLVCANAGIDASNLPEGGVLLLPADPDRSAAELRSGLIDRLGLSRLGVVVSDTFGRAWREGQTDVAIGSAGVQVVRDERGGVDREGRHLDVTLIALADQIAGAADLARRKAEGVPLVLVRGLGEVDVPPGQVEGAAALIRQPASDLFAHGRGWLAARLRSNRDTDPLRPPSREGPLTDEEIRLLAAIAPPTSARSTDEVRVEISGAEIRTEDGVTAGMLLAAVLDLGYSARLVEPTSKEQISSQGHLRILIA